MSFIMEHKVRFDDVDGAGIVYYPKFFHLCHLALEDFFDSVAPFSYSELIRDRRLGLPTVAIESSFTVPLEYGDTAVLALDIESVGNSSVVFSYHMRKKAEDVECFTARITTVMMNLDTRESTPIPPGLRTLFETFSGAS